MLDAPLDPPQYYCGFFTGAILRDFIEYVAHPMVHACWDTGHANMDGGQYENLMTLGGELRGIHVHDNYGVNDDHAVPYFGTLSLDELMHGLIDCGYKGCFTFEACSSLGAENFRNPRRRVYESDKRLFKPSLPIKLAMEKVLYEVGKHALQSYGLFEE